MINLFKYFKKKPHYKVVEAGGFFAIMSRENEFYSITDGVFWPKESRFFLGCWTDDERRAHSIVDRLNVEFDND